jgi:phosphatidylglycerol:prolipoprotein diacylglycerol transferase
MQRQLARPARHRRQNTKDDMNITISLDPVLLEVGGVAILRWYSLAITLAIFVAVWLIDREFKRKGLDTSHYGGIATWTIVLGILGARLFHVVDDWSFYSDNPERILQIQRGGLAIWGAVIMGALGVYIGCRMYNVPFLKAVDAVAPGLVLAQAIGRWGNIVNGDAWGAPTGTDFFTFTYTNPDSFIPNDLLNVPTHPYPVYDMLLNLIVFGLIWKLRTRPLPDGALFAVYLVAYGIGRFFIHGWFRQEEIWFLSMQQAQFFSLVGVVVGIAGLALLYYRDRLEGGGGTRIQTVPPETA